MASDMQRPQRRVNSGGRRNSELPEWRKVSSRDRQPFAAPALIASCPCASPWSKCWWSSPSSASSRRWEPWRFSKRWKPRNGRASRWKLRISTTPSNRTNCNSAITRRRTLTAKMPIRWRPCSDIWRMPGVPILARMAGHDLIPNGNTHREAAEIAQLLEAAGADAFNVTGGWHQAQVPQITGDVPTGAYAWLAQTVKDAVSVPVAAANRINDPFVAERMIRGGQADFVSMGRPLLADPYLPRKLIDGASTRSTTASPATSAWTRRGVVRPAASSTRRRGGKRNCRCGRCRSKSTLWLSAAGRVE